MRIWIGIALVLGMTACERSAPPPESTSPERTGVITLAPHLTETVFALGQGSRVIATGSFCDYPPEVKALPKLGGYIDPDLERITMLRPGLLIVPGRHQKVADYAALNSIPVLNVQMDSIATVEEGIAQIGVALGCTDAATALCARIVAELDAVRKAVAGLPRPKVFIVTTRNTHDLNSLYTVGGTSFVAEVVDVAGGENIYADATEPYVEASKETVVLKAPDVVLEFHAGEALSDEEKARYVADWNGLPSLPAVKNGRVCQVMESHALRPGPRVAEIARIVARLLHPDAGIGAP
ncbi:MAG: Fe/B12 periplasmic-binding protein [Candidatus Hydrogenedentes bacterium]|nr:Fe/B12 periplasmic-binding protein [Candidatus Hydrogenedentota bacterium]